MRSGGQRACNPEFPRMAHFDPARNRAYPVKFGACCIDLLVRRLHRLIGCT
jgi:hypothetical protein